MAKLAALPYVRSGVTQGLSANAAYRNYQDTAHSQDLQGTRRQDFLRLYSETRASRARVGDAMQQDKDALPAGDQIQKRTTINARGFGQWVMIYQRTGGQADFMKTPFLIKSNQPITPAEAEARARDYLSDDENAYNRVTLGVGYAGTEQYFPQNG